jgi:hypothetical protein
MIVSTSCSVKEAASTSKALGDHPSALLVFKLLILPFTYITLTRFISRNFEITKADAPKAFEYFPREETVKLTALP